METYSILRDGASDLVADETLTTFLVGPMTRIMWLNVLVPEVSAADTLDVELEFCDVDASTTQVYNMNMAQISAAGHYKIPFFTLEEYLQVKLNLTGTDTDFGATKVWLSTAGRYQA